MGSSKDRLNVDPWLYGHGSKRRGNSGNDRHFVARRLALLNYVESVCERWHFDPASFRRARTIVDVSHAI